VSQRAPIFQSMLPRNSLDSSPLAFTPTPLLLSPKSTTALGLHLIQLRAEPAADLYLNDGVVSGR